MSIETNLPVPYSPQQISDDVYAFSQGLKQYLDYLQLPTDDVLVSIDERGTVITNLPRIVESLQPYQKERAYYISKFIASCSVGLFDSALNYLWNETLLNLRSKIAQFDLDFFYDNAISDPKRRLKFSSEEHLEGLADWELIHGCKVTGLISDVGYIHLNYIREMRNFASAAHPNHTELNGFQLLSWLQTCITEVLSKGPSEPVLTIQRLIKNIREENISESDARPIIAHIHDSPQELVHSLLNAIFGLYTDPDIGSSIKTNIELIAKAVWDCSIEEKKFEIGLKYGNYAIHGEIRRKELARNFLDHVGGLGYLTEDQLLISLQESIEGLRDAHLNFNNFYTEEPKVRTLMKFFPPDGRLPPQVRTSFVEVITMCKLGNRYGVSHSAEPYYDEIIRLFRNEEIRDYINLLSNASFKTHFEVPTLVERYRNLAQSLKKQTSDESLKRALNTISESSTTDIQSGSLNNKIKSIMK